MLCGIFLLLNCYVIPQRIVFYFCGRVFFFVEFHKIEFSVKQSTEKYCEFWWEHQHFGYYHLLRHPYILYYFIYWKFKVPITCFIYSYFQSNNFINLFLFTEIYIKTIVTYLLQAKFIVKSSFISYFWFVYFSIHR